MFYQTTLYAAINRTTLQPARVLKRKVVKVLMYDRNKMDAAKVFKFADKIPEFKEWLFDNYYEDYLRNIISEKEDFTKDEYNEICNWIENYFYGGHRLLNDFWKDNIEIYMPILNGFLDWFTSI